MTNGHSVSWPIDRKSKPPSILASVARMPTFFRPDFETTRIDRVSSYSVGKPGSEERHHDLFGPRGERHAQEDVGR